MATKTPIKKTAAAKPAAKPAARRKLNLTRYAEVTGELAAALKQYQGLLEGIGASAKIDVKAFETTVKALNKGIENFDKLTEKHEDAISEYVDRLELE